VVLIHGVGADLEMWEPVAERLAPLHDVVRYDMLGHGASAKPPGPYRLDDFVDQLRRLVEGLGLERFVLAGFSMGGLVAQVCTRRAGARRAAC
jgi:pimeloyl-ACP methyl ester carboxylesterase